jgi:hypothetical protein
MDNEPSLTNPDLAYAVQMAHATCCLAGSASYLADIREDLGAHGIVRAVRDHDTPALFDWLIKTLSFQGISRISTTKAFIASALASVLHRAFLRLLLIEGRR